MATYTITGKRIEVSNAFYISRDLKANDYQYDPSKQTWSKSLSSLDAIVGEVKFLDRLKAKMAYAGEFDFLAKYIARELGIKPLPQVYRTVFSRDQHNQVVIGREPISAL